MYSVTTAEYFTFNVNNSAFITGQTGCGKSYLVEQLIRRYSKDKTKNDIQWAFFDFKQIDFDYLSKELRIEDQLLFPVIFSPEQAIEKLEEMARLSEERVKSHITNPLIFICIDECDAAVFDTERFSNALITINKNAKNANMKLLYDTSRPSPDDVIPKRLLDSFELVLLGQQASNNNYAALGFDKENMHQLKGYHFNLIDQTEETQGHSHAVSETASG